MTDSFPDAFILLTGGEGRRLGYVDKAGIELGGRTLLERAIAVTDGRRVVVVGPARAVSPEVLSTCEDPPGGGPAAGLVAGLHALDAAAGSMPALSDASADVTTLIGILAVDHAGASRHTFSRLAEVASARGQRGAVVTDHGRQQYGVAVFDAAALRQVAAQRDSWHGAPLKALLAPITAVTVEAEGAEADDIDTPESLARWKLRVHGRDTTP